MYWNILTWSVHAWGTFRNFDGMERVTQPGELPPDPGVPIMRWTRPGFFQRMCGPRKEEYFFFETMPEPISQLYLNIGDIHFRWEDGHWDNMGTDYEAARRQLNEEEFLAMQQENHDLSARIEILLNLNTSYEMKKMHLRDKLARLESQIRTIVRMSEDFD
jgi:hypothetical protein